MGVLQEQVQERVGIGNGSMCVNGLHSASGEPELRAHCCRSDRALADSVVSLASVLRVTVMHQSCSAWVFIWELFFPSCSNSFPFSSAFTKCCQETGFLMVLKCRQENSQLKDCLVG